MALYAIRKFAWMNAFTAVAAKRKKMRQAKMMPITFRRFIHFCPLQPMVWNMLQKPWVRWNHTATKKSR